MSRLSSSLLALTLLLAPVSSFAQVNVAGDWEITFDTPQGSNSVTAQLQQDGTKLTGQLSTPFGTVPVTGTASDEDVKISGSVEFGGQKLEMRAGAKLEEGRLVGAVTFGDFGEFPFIGKRPVAAEAAKTTAPGPALGATPSGGDAAGTWNLKLNVAGNQLPITATLQQDGEKVAGTLSSIAGDMPVSGTMIGKSLKLEFTVLLPTGALPVTMTGDLGDEGFAGKAAVVGVGEADWTGKRAN